MTNMQSHSRFGFTLAEIVITLAIISTVVVSLIALLPAGIRAASDATDRTITAIILEDVHDRLETERTRLIEGSIGDGKKFFYDAQGVYIPPEADNEAQEGKLFWADVNLVDINPKNLPQERDVNSEMMAIRVKLWWPVDSDTGKPLRDEPGTTITYYATSLVGVDWSKIDPEYEPRIEF